MVALGKGPPSPLGPPGSMLALQQQPLLPSFPPPSLSASALIP